MTIILLKALYFKETQSAETIKNPTDKFSKEKKNYVSVNDFGLDVLSSSVLFLLAAILSKTCNKALI